MKEVAVIAFAALAPVNALCAGIDFSYENFYYDPDFGRAKIILKVTNNTGRDLQMVIAECAFLDRNNRAIDKATLIGSNVAASEHAYVEAWSSAIAGIEKVECRISSFR